MDIPEFASVDTLRRLWWLHDSFWHAALVKGHGRCVVETTFAPDKS